MSKQRSSERRLTSRQSGRSRTISRSQITPAPYNPRIIDPHARKKLERTLRTDGLVEALVWNERTGHLVGGHQRLAILDEMEGGKDYQLTVSVIDVDLKIEKEINVMLNNQSLMGDWDSEALERLVTELAEEDPQAVPDMGFDATELQMICESETFGTVLSEKKDGASMTLEELRRIEAEGTARFERKDECDFFLVVLFETDAELVAFRERMGLEGEARFINGRRFWNPEGAQADGQDGEEERGGKQTEVNGGQA